MSTDFFIFLRAINVAGKNIVQMKACVDALESNGLIGVRSYIQSGNFIVTTDQGLENVKKKFHTVLQNVFAVETELFVFTKNELSDLLKNNPFSKDLPGDKIFFGFLKDKPQPNSTTQLIAFSKSGEELHIEDKIIYYYLPNGAGKSKLTNQQIEAKLSIRCTSRNRNTIEKMLKMF